MVTPQSVLLGLPSLKWRNLVSPPYDSASYNVTHSLAERRFPYVDGAAHDNTGRDPIEFPFKLYFLNTLEPDLFPGLFAKWEYTVVADSTAGALEHPVLGLVNCRPKSWNVTMSTSAMSGAIVEVVFVETITDAVAKRLLVDDFAVDALAATCDSQMADLNIPYPTGQRTTSLKDLLGQIRGLLFSTRLTIEGMINQAQGIVADIVGIVETVRKDHETWPLETNLKRLYNSFGDLAEARGVTVARATSKFVTTMPETIGSLAGVLGNTDVELMGLNINLLRSPTIPVGTAVVFFTE